MIRDMTDDILSISETLSRVSTSDAEIINARGTMVRPPEIAEEFRGSLQPMTGKDLVDLPVGYVIDDKWKLYVPISEIELERKDVVISQAGFRLIVIAIEDWSLTGAYKKYILESASIGAR